MASLIFAHAKSIRRLALRECEHIPETYNKYGELIIDVESRAAKYNEIIERERTKFREVLKIAKLLHEDYVEISGNTTSNWYFITIRPRPDVDWLTFYQTVRKFIARKCMLEYKLSFEQKNDNGNGEGFHVHLVANTSHRSKGECLRDARSTFGKVAADNCIEVRPTRNPVELFENYCIEYKSKDDHKAGTKEGDKIWRDLLGLCAYYDVENPPPAVLIKSVEDSIGRYIEFK